MKFRRRKDNKDGSKEEKLHVASQWQLIRWKFFRHKLAVISLAVLAMFYFCVIFAEFVACYDPHTYSVAFKIAPPQRLHFIDDQGNFSLRPFAYEITKEMDPKTWKITYKENRTKKCPLRFLVHGDPYELWGFFHADIHLFGFEGGRCSLLGRDAMGRDMFSRIIYGTRISLSIGLVGVALSFAFGIILGGVSGYFGGRIDLIIQRVTEAVRSIPTLPLWMGLSVALPTHWSITKTYFAIVVILSIVGWTSLVRMVRGKFMSIREEDFVMAAKLYGASESRIIFKYLLPSFYSHIIASATLYIPWMILAETSLSFIGLGMQAPAISWGVLLKDAQHVRIIANAPWILTPGLFVVLSILAFNFVGDGLRDAADPYATV